MFFGDRLEKETKALAALTEAASRGLITFAMYDHSGTPAQVAQAFRKRLRIPFSQLEMSVSQKRLADAIALLGNQKRCIFVTQTEAAFPELLHHLNTNAERFRHSPHCLVVWVTESGLEQILTGAPTFAALRSRLFDFRMQPMSWGPDTAAVNSMVCKSLAEMKTRVRNYRDAIRTATQPTKLADLYNRLGFALASLHSYAEARQAILKSLKLARTICDRSLEADDLFLLGQIALYRNQVARAEVLLQASARMTNGHLDAGMNWAFSNLANRRGEFTKATAYAQDSVAQCRTSGDKEGLALALRQLAQCHQAENRLDEAEVALREVLALPRDQMGMRDRALAEWNMAEITARRGMHQEAEGQMWRILRQFQDLQDYESLALAWFRLAALAESRGEWGAAEERLEEAKWLWQEAGRDDYAVRMEAQIERLKQFRSWNGSPEALTA